MKRKISMMLVAALVVLSCVGCGKDDIAITVGTEKDSSYYSNKLIYAEDDSIMVTVKTKLDSVSLSLYPEELDEDKIHIANAYSVKNGETIEMKIPPEEWYYFCASTNDDLTKDAKIEIQVENVKIRNTTK